MELQEKLNIRRLKFLEDTINHYSNLNRCIKGGHCKYSPIGSDNTTEGCAIGRHLSSDLQVKLDNIGSFNSGVTYDKVFNQLPLYMRLLGQSFLVDIQRLHDSNGKWDIDGLSNNGKKCVENIKSDIKNNHYENNHYRNDIGRKDQ